MERSRIASFLMFAFAVALGAWGMNWYNNIGKHEEKHEADLILEQVKSVSKMVTTEAYFSEMYKHEDYWGADFSFFKKKALIRVKAKVLAGYDFEKIKFEADEKNKILKISNVGEPKVLGIDHSLDYFNMDEGIFNSFKSEDYTRLGVLAKQFVEKRAVETGILENAKVQTNAAFQAIGALAKGMGWQMTIEGVPQGTPPVSN
ncbi:MAG: hypothetical protein RL757_979 [Bacteroidota bacterium]|jgi:hypothetical protein